MSRTTPRLPQFAKGDAVACSDADAREYRGVVLSHYLARGGYVYSVGIDEIDGTLHFPEHRMRRAPPPPADPAASGRAAEAEAPE